MAAVLFQTLLLFIAGAGAESSPTRAPFLRQTEEPHIVQLHRESKKGLVSNGADLIVYTANLRVGEAKPGRKPQDFRVVFDLASGQVMIPSKQCREVTCLKHRRYNKWASQTAQDINSDGTPVHPDLAVVDHVDTESVGGRDQLTIGLDHLDLGAGEIKGDMLHEKVCLNTGEDAMTCATVSIVAATEMTDLPFRVLPQDGIVGLGLDGVALSSEFSFLKHFFAETQGHKRMAQQFGLFLGGENGGELALGGYDKHRVQSPLAWVPVLNPEQGFWQMEILAVRLGNQTLDVCGNAEGGCRGIVDTGASQVSVPATMASPLEEVIRTALIGASGQDVSTDLQLVLDGATVTIPAASYAGGPGCLSNPAACRPMLARHHIADPIGRGVFVLGDSVLRPYYTVFDLQEKRIGFGAASGATAAMKAGLLTGPAHQALSRNESSRRLKASNTNVLLLIQVTTRRSVTKVML
mmetsp:Transcript_113924/g.219256  ORF Transcript_113924/g.219256 Transcript_113924/m.219256 type:complete len:466 (-) Transcript_113924:96-1493(-)